MKALFLSIGLLCLLPSWSYGQNIPEPDTTKKKTVNILFSELLENIRTDTAETKKLSGNVQLKQDSVLMFCDTAFLKDNNVIAYGEVIIRQNDSLTIFSDSLVYRGDKKIADLYGNVVLEDGEKQLFTDYLNYEFETKVARYHTGALLNHKTTQVISKKGYYYVNTDELYLKDSITVIDSAFALKADTLLFNSETQVVTFLGPTLIAQDSSKIYCESA